MELQIALDRMPAQEALAVVASVAPLVDWIEVGTSMIKQEGAAFIRSVADAAGSTPVLADLKTADDARWEFTMAYAAGARSATVLGLASEQTVDAAQQVAREHGLELVVDLMGLDSDQRAELAARVGPEVVLAAHVAKDAQRVGASPLDQLGPWAEGRRLAVAGGLTADALRAMAGQEVRAIVGSAVTASPEPVTAVQQLLEAAGRSEAVR